MASYFESDYALSQPSIRREDVIFYHDIFPDLVRWPQGERLIKFMARIPVTRTKSLWNAWRRIRAKARETVKFTKRNLRLGEYRRKS